MAFGDSGNDITMLKTAGCSYAMSSGSELAKEAAKFVTKHGNNEGGVGANNKLVLLNIFLITPPDFIYLYYYN